MPAGTPSKEPARKTGGAAARAVAFWWAVMVALSAGLTVFLHVVGCPAGGFLGPMGAAIILAMFERGPKVPAWSFSVAQGFIGGLVARALSAESWMALGGSWPFILGGTVWGLIAGVICSLILFRLNLLPGPSAFWCLSPGGAGVMVIMSGSYGADMRLVAFTQYYRVLLVSLAAVSVSALWLAAPVAASSKPALVFFPEFSALALFVTVAAVLSGYALARMAPVPGGLLLLPMAMAVLFKSLFHAPVTLPPWLLYPCYALVGWRIGLSFTRSILVAILRLIPAITLAIVSMVAFCSLYSLVLWACLGQSPLTAYLASCPGGLDAVTIIASSSEDADLPFIMAMQAMRLILVILSGPWLYSWLTRRYGFKRVDREEDKEGAAPQKGGQSPEGAESKDGGESEDGRIS